jgi:hypothetical protein
MSEWYKATRLEVVNTGQNYCMIAETVRDKRTNSHSELFIQGLLSTIPHYFGLPHATANKFESSEDEPGDYIYEINWVARPGRWWSAGGLAIGFLAAIATGFFMGWETLTFYLTAIFMLIGYSAGREIDLIHGTNKIYRLCDEQADSLAAASREMERLNEELSEVSAAGTRSE